MRTTLAVILTVASASLAHAQTRRCEVTYVHAPEDARRTIEAWIEREPRCATTLELRVVPTEGALYLYAIDAAGHVHERIVPDAEAAGALVASWIADDSLDPPPPPSPPAPTTTPGPMGAPGAGEPNAPPRAEPRWWRKALDRTTMRMGWFANDGAFETGLRGEVEVQVAGGTHLYAALAGVDSPGLAISGSDQIEVSARERRFAVGVAQAWGWRGWTVRLRVGLVARSVSGTGTLHPYEPELMQRVRLDGVPLGTEVSLLATVPLGSHVALVGGPMKTWSNPYYLVDSPAYSQMISIPLSEIAGYAGLQIRL